MGADQLDIDPRGDQEFERRIVGRLSKAVKTTVLQVRNARRELKAEQCAECEDVVGFAAAVGVMAANFNVTQVIEQRNVSTTLIHPGS